MATNLKTETPADTVITQVRAVKERLRYRWDAIFNALPPMHDGEWIDISRFDTAHGCPHQDILGKSGGLLQKVWYDGLTSKEVFALAITTFQREHDNIKSNYFAH